MTTHARTVTLHDRVHLLGSLWIRREETGAEIVQRETRVLNWRTPNRKHRHLVFLHPFSHVKLVLFTRLALRAPDKRKKMSSIPHANSYVNHLTGSSFVVVFQYPIYPPSPPEERAIVAKKAVTNVWKQFQKPLSRPQHQHTNLRSACVRDTIWFVHMFTPSKARWLTIPPALYVTSSSPSVSNNSLTGTSSLKKLKRFSVCEARARYDQAKRINTLKALVLSYHLRSTFLECFSKDLRKTIVITKDNSNNGKYSGEAKWTQENKPAVIAQKFRRE